MAVLKAFQHYVAHSGFGVTMYEGWLAVEAGLI